jgi:predicted RNA polymerase sigma factor
VWARLPLAAELDADLDALVDVLCAALVVYPLCKPESWFVKGGDEVRLGSKRRQTKRDRDGENGREVRGEGDKMRKKKDMKTKQRREPTNCRISPSLT